MEICSDMTEIANSYNSYMSKPVVQYSTPDGVGDEILDAHNSTNMKVTKPRVVVSDVPNSMPKVTMFSDIEANKRVREINNDIYESTANTKQAGGMNVWPDMNSLEDKLDIKKQMKKEEDSGGSEHGFNRKLYFKIFCGVGLTTLIIACIRKFRK